MRMCPHLTNQPFSIPQAVAYEYNTDFSRVLAQRMEYFGGSNGPDALNRVQGQLSEVKGIMIDNIEKVSFGPSISGTICA